MEGRKEEKENGQPSWGGSGADTGVVLGRERGSGRQAGAWSFTLTSSGAPHPGLALRGQRQALTKRNESQPILNPWQRVRPGLGPRESTLPWDGTY